MSEDHSKRRTTAIARRKFLKHSLLSPFAALAALVSPARAEWRKMTKKEAGYVEKAKSAAQTCAQCLYFIDPNDCVIVQGPVKPNGWCTYYGD
ncbi:MAG TPA: hypothetical protein VG798_00575 [Rhizomicrobium sp.]|nr:hypothetical protein [Rhizomicrobium sp.]